MIQRLYRRRKPGSVKLLPARSGRNGWFTAPHNSIHLASTGDNGTIAGERR
jgi:hypothetical protein